VDGIVVVDNASSDATDLMVREEFREAIYLKLPENRGSAGGFNEGVKWAYEAGFDWMWLMDDDTIQDPECLAIMKTCLSRNEVGAPLKFSIETKEVVKSGKNIPLSKTKYPSLGLPFNGFLVSRDVVRAIGLPIKEYFIDRDDIEYTIRAAKHGFGSYIITSAKVFHPDDGEIRLKPLSKRITVFPFTEERIQAKLRNIIWTYRLHKDFLDFDWVFRSICREFLIILLRLDFKGMECFLRGLCSGMAKLPRVERLA